MGDHEWTRRASASRRGPGLVHPPPLHGGTSAPGTDHLRLAPPGRRRPRNPTRAWLGY